MATAPLARPQLSASQLAKHQQARIARTAYLYILPAGIIILLITFWPLIYQLWMSFTNYSNRNLRTDNLILQMIGSFTGNLSAYNSPQLVGLANYVAILANQLNAILSGFDFWRILLFNFVWTFVNLFFHVSIGVAVAVLLNQPSLLFKRFYRSIYIIPWAMPGLVTAMIWRNMFDDQSGAVNQVLKQLGLAGNMRWLQQVDPPLSWLPPYVRVPDGSANAYFFLFVLIILLTVPYLFRWVRQHWLAFTIAWWIGLEILFVGLLPVVLNAFAGSDGAQPASVISLGSVFPLSFYAVLATNVWLGWPFMMAIATGALQSIPRELYEAAEVDGSTGWQSFWGITVPLIRPAMIPAIIIGMMLTFNQFNVIYFVSGGGPLHQSEILVTQAYRLVNETTINLAGLGNVRPYGVAASFAYIVFAVLVTITLITNRVSRRNRILRRIGLQARGGILNMIGRMTAQRQVISQLLALLVLAIVLFPVLWIVSMAIDPRELARPTSFIPPGASLQAFIKIFSKPTPNPVSFIELLRNSALLAVGVSAFTVLIGTTAAYAFSRFRFPGRQVGMIGFILVLMLPSVATVAALFVMLNIVLGPELRNSIFGVGVAMIASSLPFAIWNMKGFIDTIPRELEEAAVIDGATANQTFYRIMLPLALPGLAVTALLGFMAGWQEFVLSWQFISNPKWFTLSMALYGMQGQYASNTPWSQFAAMSIVVSIPIIVVFFALQKYIVGGLTLGGVKG